MKKSLRLLSAFLSILMIMSVFSIISAAAATTISHLDLTCDFDAINLEPERTDKQVTNTIATNVNCSTTGTSFHWNNTGLAYETYIPLFDENGIRMSNSEEEHIDPQKQYYVCYAFFADSGYDWPESVKEASYLSADSILAYPDFSVSVNGEQRNDVYIGYALDSKRIIVNVPIYTENVENGSVGTIIWNYNKALKTFTASGTGQFSSDSSFSNYLLQAEKLTIGSGITSIAPRTLQDSDNLKEIYMYDTVTDMGYENFQECPNLAQVRLSQNLKAIGYGAFCNSTALTSFKITNSVTSIGDGVLCDLPNLETLRIGKGVKEIGEGSICNLPKITKIELPDTLENVFPSAFSNIPNMTSITIPASVYAIGEESFGFVFNDTKSKYVPIEDFVIYGTAGTEAQRYAEESGIKFEGGSASAEVTLTYDVNGGTPAPNASDAIKQEIINTGKFTQSFPEGTVINLKKEDIEKSVVAPEGKELDALEINGTRYEFGTTYTLSANTEIKILYKNKDEVPVSDNPKLEFDLNGASILNSVNDDALKKDFSEDGKITKEVPKNSTYTMSKENLLGDKVAAPEGVELEAVEINGTRYELGYEYTVTDNATVKYLWNCGKIEKNCTVTFDLNGASIRNSYFQNPIQIKYGEKFDLIYDFSVLFNYPAGKILDYITVDGEKQSLTNYFFVNGDYNIKLFWKDAPDSGKTGDCSWSYDKDSGTLTISGNGKMGECVHYTSPWYPFRDGITRIVIEEGVKEVGGLSFFGMTKVKSVSLPSTLEKIGDFAFVDTGLESIKVPASVNSIGDSALGYIYDLINDIVTKVDSFTIYADEGTKAAEYANASGFTRKDASEAPAEPEPSKETDPKPDQNKDQNSDPSAQIKKVANTMKVTVKAKTLKAKKLKKKKQTVKAITVKNAQGKVTYKIVKKGTTSKIYKKVKINKKGVITFKKGKYAKKTYKIKVKITAAGTSKYNKKTVTKTVKVKVK